METQVMNRARAQLVRMAMPLLLVGLGACQEGASDVAPGGAAQTVDAPATGSRDLLEVTVGEGKLRGKLAGTTRQFLGVPYAMAPVGALRFAPRVPSRHGTA